MLKTEFTGQFKKDYKLAIKRGCDADKLLEVITLLVNEQSFTRKMQRSCISEFIVICFDAG